LGARTRSQGSRRRRRVSGHAAFGPPPPRTGGPWRVRHGPPAIFLGRTDLHNHSDGTLTATRTYTLDGTAVDERTTDRGSNKVFSLDTDTDGTADLEVGASDQTITRRWVDPFGNDRGAATDWPSTHVFLNKSETALTGLTQLGVRAYDATLGRFLSVDPVFAPSNPQQDNGNSHSANSPITNADPSLACYPAYSDALDFHTNCAGGIQKPVTHGSNAAVGAYGSKYTPPPGYRAHPRPTPVHSGGGCSYDGGTLYRPPIHSRGALAPYTVASDAAKDAEENGRRRSPTFNSP